jgi:hypothetical protein
LGREGHGAEDGRGVRGRDGPGCVCSHCAVACVCRIESANNS